jgi:hypothetical protein
MSARISSLLRLISTYFSIKSTASGILYIDIIPPTITVYANSTQIGGDTSIDSNVTDDVAVSKVIAEVTYPNGTMANYSMTNISPITWEKNLTNLAYGDYDLKVYANDTSNNWNTTTGWFEVYDPILVWFNGTTKEPASGNPISTEFSLYRVNKTQILYSFSTNSSGSYSQQLHKRYYDFSIKALNNTINMTNVSINSDLVNSTILDNIPTSVIGLSGSKISKAMYVNSVLNFTNATVLLNYSGTSYTSENAIGVYQCSNWAYTTRICSSTWTRIGSTRDIFAHTLTITPSTLSSAYTVAEFICGDSVCDSAYGESNSVCPTDCPAPTVTPGGGGGGGGPTPTEEITIPITLTTSLIEVRLYPGEYQTSSIGITNNKKTDIEVSLSVEGDIWPFTMFEKDKLTIKSKETEDAKVKFSTMLTTIPGVYNGNIVVKYGDTEQRISVILRVEYEREKLLDIKVDPITKDVNPGQNLKFQVTLYNLGFTKRVDVFINYTIKSVETDNIIAKLSETMAIETSLSFMRTIKIPEDTEPGVYTIDAIANYDDKKATSVASFNVVKPSWIVGLLLQIVTNWITYLILFVLIPLIYIIKKLYERYRMKKVYRARYVKPVDLNKLPKKGLLVGKISETNTDAYLNEDDLTAHMIVAGGTGSGKSVAAMDIAEEVLKKGIPVIVFDPTAQWTGFVRPCTDKKMLDLYHKFNMKKEEAKSFKGNIIQVLDPFLKIEVEKYMKEGEITVFVLNKLTPDQLDYFVRKTIDYMFSISWPESRKLKLLVVYDEVHRLLPKYAKRTGAMLEGGGYLAIERACREFRKWGIGLITISQVLLDFKGAIRAVIATETQMRTKYEGDINRVKTKYGWEYSASIPKLEIGTGLIQNPAYNNGKPWFITFRPLLHDTFRITEDELEMYDKLEEEIKELRDKVELLKSEKVDTYDMELELKLADEKVKVGQIKMAETYIDSVKSRINLIEKRKK